MSQEATIFEDNFNNNSNNWKEKDDELSFRHLENGKYVFEHKKLENSIYSFIPIDIVTKKDFSISCNTTWISGVENNIYALAWGISDGMNNYYFGISASGYYSYYVSNSGQSKHLIDWTQSSFINKKGNNTIAIKKTGSLLEFYINNNRVNQYKFEEFFGNKIGFRITNNQKILFDDLIVSYINNGFAKQTGTFTDQRDGKVYKTVKIGTQIWFAENLAYKPNSGNYWAYGNNQSNVSKYGYLYNWETAKIVCPNGWRLPTKIDFETLFTSTEVNGAPVYSQLIADGSQGFSALFAGWSSDGGRFISIGEDAVFWSSTVYGSLMAWSMELPGTTKVAHMLDASRKCGFSVRCLKGN